MTAVDSTLAELRAHVIAAEQHAAALVELIGPAARPDIAYVADVPADGTVEIRWWSCIQQSWLLWHRVTGEKPTPRPGYRYLVGPNFAAHAEQCVQVRAWGGES